MVNFLFYSFLDIRHYKPEEFELIGEVSPETTAVCAKIRENAHKQGRKLTFKEKAFNNKKEAIEWMNELNDQCRFNLEEEREYEND